MSTESLACFILFEFFCYWFSTNFRKQWDTLRAKKQNHPLSMWFCLIPGVGSLLVLIFGIIAYCKQK